MRPPCFFGGGVADEFDDDFPCFQRHGAPVLGDVAEHAVFDLIPFTRSRRVVRDGDGEARFISELL